MNTMLKTAQDAIRNAAHELGYSNQLIDEFLRPEQEHHFRVKSGGKEYPAFRVQHSSRLGPYKGGIRFHHNVDQEEVQALATLMSVKTAAVGLALGGGKGGVIVDPRQLTTEELEELARDYARQLAPYIGSDKDIPAPDVNTDSQIMDWMVDEFEKITGKIDPGSFTGKSVSRGGSQGRTSATGLGAVLVLKEYLKEKGLTKQPLTVALQGFGNAGYYFAQGLQEHCPNLKIIAIANSKHTWVNRSGFDISATERDNAGPDSLKAAKSAEVLASEAVLFQKVDILVLAALEDSVTEGNVGSVPAKVIVEVANGPVTMGAAENLAKRGVAVLPDVVTNAGGVIVSYLEWEQNLRKQTWTEAEVIQKMSDRLIDAAREMFDRAEKRHINYKQAAFEIALKRLMG